MANLNSTFTTPTWPDIYQIETNDPVLGGAGGIANLQAASLVERTEWLKAQRAAPNGVCELVAGKIPVSRIPVTGSASTLAFTGSQQLATSVFTTLTLTPQITDNDLFNWAAGIFTVKKAGIYRFTSCLHFAINQASGNSSAVLNHIYTLGAGNTTVFSPAPTTYNNHKISTAYSSPGSSSSGSAIFNLSADGTTPMNVGDKFNLQVYTDSNAATFRNIDNSSIGKQTLVIQYLG